MIANSNNFYAELKNEASKDLVNGFVSIFVNLIIKICVSILFDSVVHSKCPPK